MSFDSNREDFENAIEKLETHLDAINGVLSTDITDSIKLVINEYNDNYSGDIQQCKITECGHHENWYALNQQETIDNQRIAIIDLRASLRTCFNSSKGALDQYCDFKAEEIDAS